MTYTMTFAGCSLAAAITFVSGCAPEVERLRQSIAHPGPAAYQRDQAIQHDPYLLDDVGPEVVGARPREYQRPLNEVERARLAAPVPPGIAAPPRRVLPSAGPSVASPTWPVAPAPPAVPNATAPAPVTIPAVPPPGYAAPVSVPAPSFQSQPRAPY